MARLAIAEAFVSRARETGTQDQLYDILAQSCADMKIRYFALLHHVDFTRVGADAIRLHNYPESWQGWFDENGLGVSDPILRASHHSSIGFSWTAVPRMIQMTASDRSVLSQARIVGIGDGFTVPAHVPGEINGSCSFAVEAGEAFPDDLQTIAQLIGGFAFEAARRISHNREIRSALLIAGDRLHPFRILEGDVFEDLEEEIVNFRSSSTSVNSAIRRYHLRRMREVPQILKRRNHQRLPS